MAEDPVASMCLAVVPCLEFVERHIPEFEGEAAELLDDYRKKFDAWILAGTALATLRTELGGS